MGTNWWAVNKNSDFIEVALLDLYKMDSVVAEFIVHFQLCLRIFQNKDYNQVFYRKYLTLKKPELYKQGNLSYSIGTLYRKINESKTNIGKPKKETIKPEGSTSKKIVSKSSTS